MNILMHQPHRMRTLTSIIVCCLLTGAAAHADQLPDQAPEGKVYAYKAENGKRGEIEIHFPAGHDPAKARVPGIIMFHGGGWTSGNRMQFRYLCEYFASRGLVAATASYELAPKNRKGLNLEGSHKRICIIDAKSAIRWYKQNAEQLGIDPERIIAGGGSAGGHIALLATTNPGLNDPNDDLNVDTSVVAYLLFNPAVTVEKDSQVNLLDHIDKDFPPAIMFWGSEDPWLRGWTPVYNEIKAREIDSIQFWEAQGQTHAFFNKQPWLDVTIAQADRFLIELGLLDGEPTLPAPETGETVVEKP